MAKADTARAGEDRSAKESANEVWVLVRDYAKQETLEPLKGLLGYAKWGVVAALLAGIGIVELMIAVLRAVQVEAGDVLDGRWSFVPYAITLVVAGVVLLRTRRAMTSKEVPVS